MDSYASLLYETLKSKLAVCRTGSNWKQIVIRCVYCGDSVKSSSSAHFYIQAYSPYYCYCQRCGTQSAISTSLLSDFRIDDPRLKLETVKMEKQRTIDIKTGKKRGNNKFIESILHTNDFHIPEYSGTTGEIRKLEYVNERLGIDLDLYDAAKFSLILNFKKFIVENEIGFNNTSLIQHLPVLNKHCVGFLSQDKNFIVFRSLDPDQTGFRYFNFNISGQYDNTRKYYTIKKPIDLMNPKINIVITEGIFDLLSVYHNIYKGKSEPNTVFMSTNGIGMNLVINTVCKLGFLDPAVEIYADNGVNIKKFKGIKETNPFILPHNKIKVLYNKISKDVGVPEDQIDLKYTYV